MSDEALLMIRRPGIRLLTGLLWLNVPILYAVGLAFDGRWWVAIVGAVLNVMPTALVIGGGRSDFITRLIVGITIVSFPALYVYALEYHPWQMDMHMYFFAALAALTVLCDRRVILVSALFVTAHHLVLNYLAPAWVFSGSGDLPRVLLHGLIVAMQATVLLWLTDRLSRTIVAMADSVRTSETLRVEAEGARAEVERTLLELRKAQQAAERQREIEEELRSAKEAAERRRLMADAIEARLGFIAAELSRMGNDLAVSKSQLVEALEGTASRTGELRGTHDRAEQSVREMAHDTDRLVTSILQVGRNADDARRTAAAATQATDELSPKVDVLAGTVEAASNILKLISSIASQSSLLSLNARIEASRREAGGQGFAVVASEIKVLANRTAEATLKIESQLDDIRSAVAAVSGAIETTSKRVESIDSSAAQIADVVRDQIDATTLIARASEEMAGQINIASREADALSQAISEMCDTMQRTDRIASAVSDRSHELNETIQVVLSELRAA